MGTKIEKIKALVEKIFQNDGKWSIVKNGNQVSTFDQLDKMKKSEALHMVCREEFTEQQIAYMQLTEDFSSGFALTTTAFCTGGNVGNKTRSYKDIQIENSSSVVFLLTKNGDYKYMEELCSKDDLDNIEEFLKVAKNF